MNTDFILRAESLASKWGFGDGDSLQDYMYDLQDAGLITSVPNRDDFLYAVVMRYLVPELESRGLNVEIVKIGSNHNPVRADTVNGVEVDYYRLESCPEVLRGIEVSVPQGEFIALAALPKETT